MKLLIVGGMGRMGKVAVEVAKEKGHDTFIVDPRGDIKSLSEFEERPDCVLDFSTPEGTVEAVNYCLKERIPLVSGTTGFKDFSIFQGASRTIPVLYAPNFSPGVNLVLHLLKSIPEDMKDIFQAFILELHHSAKKDRPSGTAKRMAEIVNPQDVLSIRGGDEPGTHVVYLMGTGETVEIVHRARNRKIFAEGAICACEWIIGKKPGLYSMGDVWNLKR